MNIMEHMTETVIIFWYCLLICISAWGIAYYIKAFSKWVARKLRKLLKKETVEKE